jgi:hypothetical protein
VEGRPGGSRAPNSTASGSPSARRASGRRPGSTHETFQRGEVWLEVCPGAEECRVFYRVARLTRTLSRVKGDLRSLLRRHSCFPCPRNKRPRTTSR